MSRLALRSVLELGPTIQRRRPCCIISPSALSRTFNTTPQPPFTNTTQNIDPPSTPATTLPARPRRAPATSPFPSPGPLKPISDSVRQLLPALKSQPAHYITTHIHGFPYLVTVGDQIRLPVLIPGVLPGDVLRLNRASVLGSRDYTLKGTPYLDERLFECRATVLGAESEPMRVEIKKKQRCRRKKHVKSKLRFTILRISELKIKSVEEVEAEAKAAVREAPHAPEV